MKLKIALIAVALIAGSAWAGKQVIPLFTIDGVSVTPVDSKFVGDFDTDGTPDIVVNGYDITGKSIGWAVYSWKKGHFLFTSDNYSSFPYLTEFSYDNNAILHKNVVYTYDNGTSAASSNP